MKLARLGAAFAVVGLALAVWPTEAHAWTPGTHVYLGQSVLANLQLLPAWIAELLRSYPFEFLYGNIAADTSIAKKYAPLGRHCHYWHVGQEIHDLATTGAMRAFGWGYLSHLAADTIAHNYFVPRQLVLTSTTSSVGHSYWESRAELEIGPSYARAARDLIRLDTREADAHLEGIIAPTLFSVRTNRRLFRGMVRLTESSGWQRGMEAARDRSRWGLAGHDVARHLDLGLEFMLDLLAGGGTRPRRLDPSGMGALASAKLVRRHTLRDWGRGNRARLRESAEEHFGLPAEAPRFLPELRVRLPWRPATAEPLRRVS